MGCLASGHSCRERRGDSFAMANSGAKPPQPKKAFLKKLLRSKPIEPKQQIVAAPPDFATDEEKRFCSDFADFGAVVNWWLADEFVGSS